MRVRLAAVLLAALLLLVTAALEAFNLFSAYADARAGSDEARTAARTLGSDPASWTAERVDRASAEADDASRRLARAHRRLAADPALSVMSAVPFASDQARAARDAVAAAEDAAGATEDAISVARAYRSASTGQGSPQRFLDALKSARPALEDATARLRRALALVNADRARPLLPPLPAQLASAAVELARALDEADGTLAASRLVPAALGDPAPRTYLVILANPTELRPDGGFAGVVGTITFDHGSPATIHLIDQYTLNGHYRQRFPIPLPIQQHLIEANNALELGDAGWDPDLPSSAPLYEQMWQSATGQTVDGTLIIDPYAIAAVLGVTGPVTVAGFGEFDSTTFLPKLNVLINATGADKATAVPAVASQVLKAVLSQPGSNYTKIASTLLEQARERHIQIALHDSEIQKAVADARLDGAVRNAGTADYLMVVDANVGATKADYYIKKSVELRVEKPASGLTNHEVKVSYDFPALTSDTDRKLNPDTKNNPGGRYRDYLRIYIPKEATITGFRVLVDGKPAPTNAVTENAIAHDKRVVGTYFEVLPGHSAQVAFTYMAPLENGSDYSVLVQKQAGRPNLPTSVWVSYPGGQSRLASELATDHLFRVTW